MDIQGKIIGIVRQYGKINGDVAIEKDLYSELGIESFNSISILLALEEHFGLTIDDHEFVKARTVGKLIRLVQVSGAA